MSDKDIILYTPTAAHIKAEARSLEVDYTKSEIIEQIQRIRSMIESADRIRYCTVQGNITALMPKVFHLLFSNALAQYKKNDLALALAAYTADERNLETEVSCWPPELRQLLFATAENGICTQAEMDAVLPIKSTRASYYYSYDSRVEDRYDNPRPLLTWVEYAKGSAYGNLTYPTRDIYGVLPYIWQRRLYEMQHGDIIQPFPHIDDTDLSAPELTHVNLQPQIAYALTYMVQAYRADVVHRGTTRILSKSELKKIREADLHMNPLADHRYGEVLDGYFASVFAVRFMDAVTESLVPYGSCMMPDGTKILKRIFKQLKDPDIYNIQLFELMLPHLSGLKSPTLSKFCQTPYLNKIMELIANHGTQWLDVDVLKHKVYRHAIVCEEPLIMSYGIESADLHSAMTGRQVKAATMNQDIMYPLIEGYLAQLMAIGAVEAVMAPRDKQMKSYFGGLRYVRLTELGQYLFGITSDFTLQLTDKHAFEYDVVDGPLLVYSRVEGNPYDNVLSDMAVKTGRYWKVTTESFLRNCESADDIRQNITQFQQSICKNPPAAWQKFFDGLVTKAASGPTKDKTSWCIMDIAPDNTELQRLLSTDQFRDIVVRAEGYRILIKKSDYATFTKLMKQHGYLIP